VPKFLGFYFEAVGDHQLDQFIKNQNNKGKIMDTGLWALTRHPNYFGEVTMWWGLYIVALSVGAWWSIVSPIIITYLLLKVSGIPMLEAKYKDNPLYEAYKRRTNAFFPGRPKRDDTSHSV
jgi:steroid 5-alpha reductase family enzyme